MKIFLVKRDPDRPACSDNWISMNSSQFSSFLRTKEGRSRSRSFGILESCGDDSPIVIETDGGTAEELRYQRNRRETTRLQSGKSAASSGYRSPLRRSTWPR